MKVAITTNGNTLDDALDSRFGRAPRFLIVDTDDNSFQVIDNAQGVGAPQGAGIQSAMTIAKTGVDAVISGHCGPKAFHVLSEAGIKVYNTDVMPVKEALKLLVDGKLTSANNADVQGHWQ